MPTTDFSQVPDAQLDHIFGLLESNPDFIPNVDERKAFVAEYFRRRSGAKPKPAAPATNVDANLEAAASPVSADPALKPKSPAEDLRSRMVAAGYTPREADVGVRQEAGMEHAFQLPPSDETLRWGGAYMRRQDRREGAFNSSLDGIYERPAEPAADLSRAPEGVDTTYYDSVTGGMPGAVGRVVDGVFVPGRLDALGRVMTTLGDERRAKEAANDKRLAAMFSKQAQDDLKNYGTRQLFQYKRDGDNLKPGRGEQIPTTGQLNDPDADATDYPALTPDEADQQQRLAKRRDMEYRQAEQNRMLRARTGGRTADQEAASRDFIRRRAMMVGGSENLNPVTRSRFGTLEALGDPGMNDWQKMVLAETMLREPQRMTPLGAQAVGGQNALNMLRGMNLGQGMQNNPALVNAQADAAALEAQQRRAAQQQEMLDWAERHVSSNYAEPEGWGNWLSRTIGSPHLVTEFTVDEQDKAIAALMARYPHLKLAQAQQIIDSVGDTRTTRRRAAPAGN